MKLKDRLWPNINAVFFAEDATGGGGEPVVPEWLQDEGYKEIMANDAAKNILTRYKTTTDAAKALVEKEQTLRTGFRMPDNLTEEQIGQLRGRIDQINGVPAEAAQYELAHPEMYGELDLSDSAKTAIQQYAHANKLPPAAAQSLYENMIGLIDAGQKSAQQTILEETASRKTSTEERLKTAWGPSRLEQADKVQPEFLNMVAKEIALTESDVTEFRTAIQNANLLHNPLLSAILGKAALQWQVLEGNAGTLQTVPGAGQGAQAIQEKERRQALYPNTPVELGGGMVES